MLASFSVQTSAGSEFDNGKITAIFCKPLNLLVKPSIAVVAVKGSKGAIKAENEKWLTMLRQYRVMCIRSEKEFRATLRDFKYLNIST